MTLTRRLMLTLSTAIAGLLLVGVTGLVQSSRMHDEITNLADNYVPSIEAVADMDRQALLIRTFVLQHILNPDAAKMAALDQEIAKTDKALDATLDYYQKNLASDDKDRQLLEADRALLAQYREKRQITLELSRTGKKDEARTNAATVAGPRLQALMDGIKAHIAYIHGQTEQAHENASARYQQGRLWSIIITLLALGLSTVLALWLIKAIRTPLQQLKATVSKVSQQLDFTSRSQVLHQDEIGETVTAFNTLLERLQANLQQLYGGAGEVAVAAQQMAQTASQLSQSASKQSESSAAVAATVEQMTVSINHIAERSSDAHQLARDSGQLAREGSSIIGQTITDIRSVSQTVSQVAGSIRELEAHSQQIGSVLAVIKEVADQTNLLALNAAIEAARAGEQGRGFAVVADEVRKLAERTSASTQEIAATIAAMRQQSQQAADRMQEAESLVSQSVSRADHADQAMARIGEAAHRTEGMVSDIASAIQQQSAASSSMAANVEQIAQMTEEASVAAQESSGSATHLQQLSRQQQGILEAYRLA
ncbi:methyl-accepting chemotaxis protein [Leeia aquatica]|uniref:Methyl-accepting chemotaxis protein n=1 Tax=Leeia aquatica TaxID=2725557 RepID=A0A847SC81_9NEIS|nr:methyl-accepting chemotaxis protein [Leeia aquatica]NLR74738.1 methyl-accepting chemotaxis protein [Leeia aquatica]